MNIFVNFLKKIQWGNAFLCSKFTPLVLLCPSFHLLTGCNKISPTVCVIKNRIIFDMYHCLILKLSYNQRWMENSLSKKGGWSFSEFVQFVVKQTVCNEISNLRSSSVLFCQVLISPQSTIHSDDRINLRKSIYHAKNTHLKEKILPGRFNFSSLKDRY